MWLSPTGDSPQNVHTKPHSAKECSRACRNCRLTVQTCNVSHEIAEDNTQRQREREREREGGGGGRQIETERKRVGGGRGVAKRGFSTCSTGIGNKLTISITQNVVFSKNKLYCCF